MRIEHIAIWTDDIEAMKSFYQTYFGMMCSEKYLNSKNNFTSYFRSFGKNKTRIELMNKPDISDIIGQRNILKGLTHFAISVGSEEKVNELTQRLRADNYVIAKEPRRTGDGYYESLVLDPEENYIEITI
ncbi:MAG: VOC family protein [Paludibacter sp.]|nr:VOC family protein [Paludibacter sp.]